MAAPPSETDVDAVDRSDWAIQDGDAHDYVRTATRQVGSLVRSTLGPRGLTKLVKTHDLQGEPEAVVTGDAEGILAAVERGDGFNDPVAALFVDCVDSMQRSLGDGTTTAIVLTEALVARGLELVEMGVHPSVLVVGYSMAAHRTGEVLDELAEPCDPTDHDALAAVAATAVTADIDATVRERYARSVAETITGLAANDDGWLDIDDVAVVAGVGAVDRLHRGVVLRRQPGAAREEADVDMEFDWTPAIEGELPNATVAVMDEAPAFGEAATSFDESTVSPDQYARDLAALDARRNAFADRAVDFGVDVFVCRDETDEIVTDALDARGVLVVDRAQYPKSDVYRLADATGARVVSHPADLVPDALGMAGRVSELVREEEKWMMFDDCAGPVFTLVVGADTAAAVTQHERIVEDALEVASVAAIDRQVLPGAGAPAAAVAADLRRFARSVEGREQLAIEAFAEALETIPETLARNAGLDPIDSVATLRNAHAGDGRVPVGLDLDTGDTVDAYETGIVEPRRVFSQAVETARAAAEGLLTLDAVLFPSVDTASFTPRLEHE